MFSCVEFLLWPLLLRMKSVKLVGTNPVKPRFSAKFSALFAEFEFSFGGKKKKKKKKLNTCSK